jgi:hypothetical protein
VRSEVHDPVLGELALLIEQLDSCLGSPGAKPDFARGSVQSTRNGTELVGRFGQRHLRAHILDVDQAPALRTRRQPAS